MYVCADVECGIGEPAHPDAIHHGGGVALRIAIAQTACLFIFINRLALIGMHNLLRAAFRTAIVL